MEYPDLAALTQKLRSAEPLEQFEYLRSSHSGHEHGANLRTFNYKGHEVKIETTNHISIDGVPLEIHISISDEGYAHCHGLPQYTFSSINGLVKGLLDAATEKLPKNELK